MRYYSIVLGAASGSGEAATNIKAGASSALPNFQAQSGAQVSGATWSSQIGGQNDPGALDIELDIFSTVQTYPAGGSFVRIYGVSLQQIAQASQLNRANITVYGGFAKGLPLAKPAQQGVIAQGTVYPAFGNWIGTDQTLDMWLTAPQGNNAQPVNLVHNQPAGQPLGTAAQNALSTAFPGFKTNINVSPKLVLPAPQIGFYNTLQQYAYYLRDISLQILGVDNYQGVNVSVQGKTINVFDGTTQQTPKQIAFEDLIGQPTWLGLYTVSVKTAMRGDIQPSSYVKLPQSLATVQASSAPQFRQSSQFQGTFWVRDVRHSGRFRQPLGDSWVSIFSCVALGKPGI